MNGSLLTLGLVGVLAAGEATRRGSRDLAPARALVVPTPAETSAIRTVRSTLTPDLLKPEYRARNRKNPMAGHCAVATQSLYHLLGGKHAGYTPMQLQHEGASHWFLRARDGHVLDATADQFRTPVPYAEGVARGFMTPRHGRRVQPPSQRAQVVIDRAKRARGNANRATLPQVFTNPRDPGVIATLQRHPEHPSIVVVWLTRQDDDAYIGAIEATTRDDLAGHRRWDIDTDETWDDLAGQNAERALWRLSDRLGIPLKTPLVVFESAIKEPHRGRGWGRIGYRALARLAARDRRPLASMACWPDGETSPDADRVWWSFTDEFDGLVERFKRKNGQFCTLLWMNP